MGAVPHFLSTCADVERPSYDEHGDVTTNRLAPSGPSAPDDTGFLRARSLWVRAAALLLAAFWVGAVFLVGGFLTIASYRGGWFYVMLCVLPGLVAAARLGGVARWRDTLLVATAASFLIGLGMYSSAPPDHGRIRHVAEDVGVPIDEWELLDEREYGDTWCMGGCPHVDYEYAAAATPDEAVATLDAILEERGWTGGADDPSINRTPNASDPLERASWSNGRWRIVLSIPSAEYRFAWADDVAARGLTPVEITFGAAS